MLPSSKQPMIKLLMMISTSHLIRTAAARSCSSSTFASRSAAYMAGLQPSPSQQFTTRSAKIHAFHNPHAARHVGLCKPCTNNRFTALGMSTSTSSTDNLDLDMDNIMEDPLDKTTHANEAKENNKKKKKQQATSRKQRVAKRKEVNLTRIDKLLAHRGVGARKETFELAKGKRVTFADRDDAPHSERTRIRGPKDKVPFGASLFLDGKLLPGPPPLLLVYHKPKYVLSVMEDDKKYLDQNRKHLGQVLESRYKKAGMHPVGRLDYDTTGLILFSLDGSVTQYLLHPRRGVEKEYVATVQGMVDEEKLRNMFTEGVTTSEGKHTAQLVEITDSDGPGVVDHDDTADGDDFDELEDMAIEIDADLEDDNMQDHVAQDNYSGPYSDVRLVVKEGKYRMVRRMLANCGHPVVELKRLRHGKITLGDLQVGEFRDGTEEELFWAKSMIK